jgi:sulfur-carrier protein
MRSRGFLKPQAENVSAPARSVYTEFCSAHRTASVMAHLFFAPSIQRHITVPECDVAAGSVNEALAAVFADEPRLRGYILDDQGSLRRHLSVFVDGRPVHDRRCLSDPVDEKSRIYVVQALSGG